MNLGENIYRLRAARNLSQGDLADALEVSRQSVSKWENNSAVPELEKLIKMSGLFGVTLDELVGNETSAEPKPYYSLTEPGPRQTIPARKIAGIVLLCFGFLTFLVFAVLSFIPDLDIDFGFSLMFSTPFVLCGILCLVCRYNPGYWCAVSLYFLTWLLFITVVAGSGTMAYIVRCVQILHGLAILLWTIIGFRSEKLRVPDWSKVLTIILLLFTILTNIASMLPPKVQQAIPGELDSDMLDASVSPD